MVIREAQVLDAVAQVSKAVEGFTLGCYYLRHFRNTMYWLVSSCGHELVKRDFDIY